MGTRAIASGTGLAIVTGLTTVTLGQGGDDPASAVPLGLNTPTSGTTVDYTNTSDETCPYTGSTSPDVYYSYTPVVNRNLTVELCESGYDTKTYVYDSSLNLITNVNGGQSCNDDACSSSGGGGFRSQLNCVPVTAGLQYYVVVDGWSGDSGNYAISLRDTETFLMRSSSTFCRSPRCSALPNDSLEQTPPGCPMLMRGLSRTLAACHSF